MNLVRTIIREIVGLFVDDGVLAAAALFMLGAAGLLIKMAGVPPLTVGLLL